MIQGETVMTGGKHPGTMPDVLFSGPRPNVRRCGWYIGYRDKDGAPYSRETDYMTYEQAHKMLGRIRLPETYSVVIPEKENE